MKDLASEVFNKLVVDCLVMKKKREELNLQKPLPEELPLNESQRKTIHLTVRLVKPCTIYGVTFTTPI